ncbi:MAG TPA: hypothetical protein VMD08_14325, partial [Candidatus Baltobacteraceae bacterium]|nr:hypothetical protein [Candidatus Baltobacteraceae bacterium]
VINPAADEAQSALALVKFAGARTYVALDPPVVEAMPVFGRDSKRVVLREEGGHSMLERQATRL